MSLRFIKGLSFILTLAAGLLAYLLVVGAQPQTASSENLTGAELTDPYILYIAPPGTVRGLLTLQTAQAELGAVPEADLTTARWAATQHTPHALLIDAQILLALTPTEQAWIQEQFHNGVAIVGLGMDHEEMAKILGLKTLQASTEVDVPPSPMRYLTVSGIVVGAPEDVQKYEEADWRAAAVEGYSPDIPGIKSQLQLSFHEAIGWLDTKPEWEVFKIQLNSAMQGVYSARRDYQLSLEKAAP